MKKLLVCFLLMLPTFVCAAGGGSNPHQVKANVNLQDKASLQRGAQLFMNNCSGCHSLKYLRYERISEDLGISESLMQDNLMFTGSKLGDQVVTAMDPADAKNWFGAAPPDLTLEARLRTPDWLYSYLIGFYPDESRPYGYNNHMLQNVGMPHVLASMQATMSEEEFHAAMLDMTNVLTYVAEPTQLHREQLGRYVLLFLAILLIPAYLMKREYWKDVH